MRIIGFLVIAVTATMAQRIGRIEETEAKKSEDYLNEAIRRWKFQWNQCEDENVGKRKTLLKRFKDEERRILDKFIVKPVKQRLAMAGKIKRHSSWTNKTVHNKDPEMKNLDPALQKREKESGIHASLNNTLWKQYNVDKTKLDQFLKTRQHKTCEEMFEEIQKLALKAYQRIDHDKVILATEQLMAIKQIISEEKQLLGDTKEKLGVSHRYMPNNTWFMWVPSADFLDAADWKNIEKLEDLKAILESDLQAWTDNVEYPSWSTIPNEKRIDGLKKDISEQMKIIVHEWPVFDEFLEKSKTHTANLENVIKQLGNKIKSAKAKSAEIEEKEGDKSDLQ